MPSTEQFNPATPNIQADQIEVLRQLFPEVFTENKIDFEKLRLILGDKVEERPERYAFSWAGKRDAIRVLQTPTRATLRPLPEQSVDFETTQNVFIEGDNLEVLKLLYKAYFGRVKLIYIDPPYNTGNDFVYPDNYADPLTTYLQLTGQQDVEGNLLTSNPESSGRFHSAWLSMMYPRLFIARQLLKDDGVIFISIDDNEVHNLKILMNEIFGEENHYATIVWQKKDTPSNDTKTVSVTHEYLLVYVKSSAFTRKLLPRNETQLNNYKNPDNDPRGPWIRTSLIRNEVREERLFPIKNPKGTPRKPPPGTSWRLPLETFMELEADNRLWWGSDGNGDLPFRKSFLSEVAEGVVPITWWDYEFAGSNRNAKMEIRSLFNSEVPFDNPKPSLLITQILRIATSSNDIILDFFAGSGTTAQAMLKLNRDDEGTRRFILVQIPEPVKADNYKTIADIGEARIRRVIARMKQEREGQLPLGQSEDLGFRVFKLAPSNFRAWAGSPEAEPEAYTEQMALFNDPLEDGWDEQAVIWEVALKEGYGLNLHIEHTGEVHQVDGTPAFIYRVTDPDRGQHFYITLAEHFQSDQIHGLTLEPETLFVCRDTALDDEGAANLALQCRLKTI